MLQATHSFIFRLEPPFSLSISPVSKTRHFGVDVLSYSFLLASFPEPDVHSIQRSPVVDTEAFFFIMDVVADVSFAVLPSEFPVAVHSVVLPLSNVDSIIIEVVYSVAVQAVFVPFALVARFVGPDVTA